MTWQDIHLRILAEIPRDRIRTHEWRPPVDRDPGGKPTFAETADLHRRILLLEAEGLKQFEIAEVLRVSRTTVNKHLNGKIRSVA